MEDTGTTSSTLPAEISSSDFLTLRSGHRPNDKVVWVFAIMVTIFFHNIFLQHISRSSKYS